VIFSVALVLSLSGCTTIFHKSALTDSRPPASATRVHLDPFKSVFIAVPSDGAFGSVYYIGSGRAVASAITAAFTAQGIPVYVAEGQLASEETLRAATRLKAGYAVLSAITLWDQRNEWLGLPSALAVRVSIVDVNTGQTIESKPIETRNETVLAFTIFSPETLLEKPLNQYVSELY
jgi:hypothetical protein